MEPFAKKYGYILREYQIRAVLFIAEEDDVIRLLLKRYFESEHYLVFVGESGMEAIVKLRCMKEVGGLPDLIIIGLHMQMDGMKVIDFLMSDEDLRKIPSIPISAQCQLSLVSAKKVLTKPFDFTELIRTVNEIVDKDYHLGVKAVKNAV